MTFEEVLAAAKKLSPYERLELVIALLESLRDSSLVQEKASEVEIISSEGEKFLDDVAQEDI